MNIKDNLRKMGWNNNLIEHYIRKDYGNIKTVCQTKITAENFTNDRLDSREYIYSDVEVN